MEFDKRWLWVFGFFGILFISLFIFRPNFTGDVVWQPSTTVVNCTDTQIASLWDEIFEESSSGIEIYKEFAGNCTDFVAVKNDGVEQIWYLWQEVAGSEKEIDAIYVNASPSLYTDLVLLEDFTELTAFRVEAVMRSDEINNNSFASSEEALDFFNSKFKFAPDSLSYLPSTPQEYYSKENLTGDSLKYNMTYEIFDNKSYGFFTNRIFPRVSFDEGIDNVGSLQNSSWTEAFDVEDHFTYGPGSVFNFSYWGGSTNNNGSLINWTINSDGEVSFKPKAGYLGTLQFQLSVNGSEGNVYSNRFNVSVVSKINLVPIAKYEFPQVYLKENGSEVIYLDVFFEDPDGDKLTYRTSSLKNLTVTFNGDNMTIKANANFSVFGYEKFGIWAKDAEFEVSGGEIEVFLDESLNGSRVEGRLVDSSMLNGSNLSSGSFAGNSTAEDDKEGESLLWLIWVFVFLVVLACFGVLIYVLFLRAPKPQVSEGPSKSVQNYLVEINKPLVQATKPRAASVPSLNGEQISEGSEREQKKEEEKGEGLEKK